MRKFVVLLFLLALVLGSCRSAVAPGDSERPKDRHNPWELDSILP